VKKVLYKIIRFYKKRVSRGLPTSCVFRPTCSEYALEAFKEHGALKGLYLSIKRILRCNPFCKGGYDPVPQKRKK